jgi:uncharacterized protein YbjT (DUF2867 family)
MSATANTYVVTGATGSVGQTVSNLLAARGHVVRRISRADGVALNDRDAVREAFAGADAAFLMVPFDRQANDLHASEQEIVDTLADAVAATGTPRVVCLSGTSAHLGSAAGSGRGAGMLEERLDELGPEELVHLRGCFFMENHLQGIGSILQSGTYTWAFAPDIPTPMIAARDIGHIAAEILIGRGFDQPRVRELLGPRDHTMAEATAILGRAIGLPDLSYRQLSYEDAERVMVSAGASRSFAAAVIETARSFNHGIQWSREPRSVQNTTSTTLETFAADTFVPAYRHAARETPAGRLA